ncbi:hypothetical protein MBLNU13_g07676t1 [Cladosporium sp. NU13]
MSGKYVFSKALKELRFLHCQTSEHSNAVRYALQQTLLATIHSIDIRPTGRTPQAKSTNMSNLLRSFLNRAYPTMKHHNPHTPIMIREALNTQPRVFARYEFGREKVEELSGLDDKAIESKIGALVREGAQ